MPDQTDDITDRGPQAGKTIGKLQLFSIWYTILPHGFLVKSLGLHTVIPSQIHSFGSEAETAIVAMFVKLISPLTCSIAQINEAIQITMPVSPEAGSFALTGQNVHDKGLALTHLICSTPWQCTWCETFRKFRIQKEPVSRL